MHTRHAEWQAAVHAMYKRVSVQQVRFCQETVTLGHLLASKGHQSLPNRGCAA